jgi:hypothetical protein
VRKEINQKTTLKTEALTKNHPPKGAYIFSKCIKQQWFAANSKKEGFYLRLFCFSDIKLLEKDYRKQGLLWLSLRKNMVKLMTFLTF